MRPARTRRLRVRTMVGREAPLALDSSGIVACGVSIKIASNRLPALYGPRVFPMPIA